MKCRQCGAPLGLVLVDLGSAPPSNAYVAEKDLLTAETSYPLRVLVCEICWLVQTEDYARAEELFTPEYAYFSGYSRTWLDHVERYVRDVTARFGLDENSFVIEIAANDGHLLQFVQARGIPCLGIEPTAKTAAAARAQGLDIIEAFFGRSLGFRLAEGARADLIVANNVLAHVPDINDFSQGVAVLLKPEGVATFEFAYVRDLIELNQFDTIYHEHFSYLSMTSVERLLRSSGLIAFDVQRLPTHGGSLRVFAKRADTGAHSRRSEVDRLLDEESRLGMTAPSFYAGLQGRADLARDELVDFLERAKGAGRQTAAYGAAAKGNTLLNYAGVDSSSIAFVADSNPAKQGMYLPGSHVPIVPEERLSRDRPDYVLVLPWNLRPEISSQLRYIADWGGQFVTAIPRLEVWR